MATKAEKKARKAKHSARRVVQAHAELEARAVQTIDAMAAELKQLREVQERFRLLIFGAFLGRALGDEQKFSDALLQERPEWFKGFEEAPWMLFSERRA